MTFLLLQTFLLLLAAYFAGAFTACVAKRWLVAPQPRLANVQHPAPQAAQPLYPPPRTSGSVPAYVPEPYAQPPFAPAPQSPTAAAAAAAAARASQPRPIAAPRPQPRVEFKPRSIELVQPKIDLLPRPAPRPTPAVADTYRFERALTGPDLNENMPRAPIVEIMPLVHSWVTGPPGPWPPPKPPEPEPAPMPPPDPEPQASPVTAVPRSGSKPKDEKAIAAQAAAAFEIRQRSGVSAAAANAAAAASAALAAAKAAAASIAPAKSSKPETPAPATSETVSKKPSVEATPAQEQPKAKPVAAAVQNETADTQAPPITGGDDLQRIRAIDAATEQALKRQGATRFEEIARWSGEDIELFDDELKLSGRIDREQWIEQAQILAKGGETYYSRNRAAAARAAQTTAPASSDSTIDTAVLGGSSGPATEGPKTVAQPPPASSPSKAPTAEAQADAPDAAKIEPAPPPARPPSSEALKPGQARSVSEIAAVAAAAIAAASASVTRGRRPIEAISPLSKVDPNIAIPAKLSDAIKEKEAKDGGAAPPPDAMPIRPPIGDDDDVGDDLKRIRGVGVLIEKRLKAVGVTTYADIANWTSDDIDRVSQTLDFKGRIERENWVEQARILSSGGQTEFSRRVDRGEVDSSKDG